MNYLKIFLITLSVNLVSSQDHWETAIYASDEWRYHIPSEELSENWNSLDFDDNSWQLGIGGFGYGDNDDGTDIDPTMSIYLRRTFDIDDIEKLSSAILHTDYDDGFVAYLNGIEIARSSNLGSHGEFISYDSGTNDQDHEAQLYQGEYPEYIILDSLDLVSMLFDGENLLAIQVHNISLNSSDFSSNFFLSFNIIDGYSFFGPTPEWFQIPISYDYSNLPIIVIDTYGATIMDDPRIDAFMGIINNANGENYINDPCNDYSGSITIELRGNSSQYNEKKPYRIETVDSLGENNNVSLLGMPEENDWVLHAPYQDKSLMRNVLAYHLSNKMGRYASRTRFCELHINGDYKGVYVLMEKIKRDDNRIDISKLNPEEISGDDVTGGYILKFDWPWTGDNLGGFESENDGMIYNYHYPKPSDIVPEQEEYIINYIHDFEAIMLDQDYADYQTGYPSMLDILSFVDFILLQELPKNVDAYRLSTYIYKDKESINNKLHAGPIWDINHGFGNCDYGETWVAEGWLLDYNPEGGDQMAFWWELLWGDENFKTQVFQRYNELRSNLFSNANINSIIDSLHSHLGESVSRNFNRWPILGEYTWPNYYVFDTYEEEVDYLKTWTIQRLEWMDEEMFLSFKNKTTIEGYSIGNLYPNPFNASTKFYITLGNEHNVNSTVYDLQGRIVETLISNRLNPGKHSITFDASSYSSGTYFIKTMIDGLNQTKKVTLVK